jgi:hypothetical protein
MEQLDAAGRDISVLPLPATPAALMTHLIEGHGWVVQGYHPSMVTSHRFAHGADIPAEQRTPVDHDHPFGQSFKGFMGGGRRQRRRTM